MSEVGILNPLLLEKGKRHFQKGDYSRALQEFRKLFKLTPENAEVLFELGKVYYVLRKYSPAVKFLRKAIAGTAANEAAHILLAKTYRSLGKYRESREELVRLKESGCENPEIDNELVFLERERYSGLMDVSEFFKNRNRIIKGYRERIKINPGDEKSISHLAQLYNLEGKYKLTRELVSRTLKLIPEKDIFFRNKLLNELEIASGKVVLSSQIRSLTVTLSNRCNLSCIMCLTRHTPWEIPKETVKEIFSLFPYLEKIMWQGGEVFVLDYFEELLSRGFRYPNLRQSIVTNGQLISAGMAEKLVRNNVELTFSVDGVTKKTYEHIRRGASFEILRKNLKLILALRKRYDSNMTLNLNIAIMKSNYRQLEGFIDFAEEYGFGFVCLMPIHIHLKTPQDIFTNRDSKALTFITESSPVISEKARKYGIRLENRLPTLNSKNDYSSGNNSEFKPRKKLLCHIPWQQLYIDYDGTVRPDCLCSIQRSAGNLLKEPSLKKIWNNEVLQDYRRRIIKHDFEFCDQSCISGKIAESHLKIP